MAHCGHGPRRGQRGGVVIYGSSPKGIVRRGISGVELLDMPFADLGSALLAGITREELDPAPVVDISDEANDLLAPVPALRGNVWALGLAYQDHVNEAKSAVSKEAPAYPPVFLKAASSITAPGVPISLPKIAPDEVDYEGEIAVVIGRAGHDIPANDGWDYVFGITAANDVSARDVQFGRFTSGMLDVMKAKSFDTFTPLGPWVVTPEEFANRDDIGLATYVNGEQRQSARSSSLFWTIPEIIAFVSQFTTLSPGDVILTGTPGGTGRARQQFLKAGDVVRVDVELVGSLINPVAGPDYSN
jgi:2-keto-4-pentenoate hydratase/2-oxohepta-3-ene-1,7-dioic acid hydratase in catechol pathway